MKKVIIISVGFLLLCSAIVAGTDSSEIILEDGIIDLRGAAAMPSRNGMEPGELSTPDDLEIGSVFLTVDNHARKVVDIYEHNGRTIIETIEPRPEEVFLALYVPDFEQPMGREHISVTSIADGVTVLPPGAGRGDMLSSNFSVPAEQDRTVTWLETHSANDGKDVLTINVDIKISTDCPAENIKDKLKEYADTAKENDRKEQEDEDNPDGQAGDGDDSDSDSDSSKPKTELDASVDAEIGLEGTIRLVEPTFTAGIKRPKLKFSWVSKWWGGYFTIKHESGYIKGGIEAAHQLDMKMTGTVSLGAELKIPVVSLVYTNGAVTAIAGLYLKIGVNGQISMAVEFSEYCWTDTGAQCNLVWPFIPTHVSGYVESYNNFAFRPIVSAEAEAKAGLYLGAELEVLGVGMAGAEAGGGAYIAASGYMEPMGIMGFDYSIGPHDSIGAYGSFDNWILELEAEAGIYAEITAEVIGIELDLWEQRWPFWEWHMDMVM
ncbi:MAG TPA: hypothetical protein DCO79_06575 [Spirochaeta sp.]|nr:hypothetical protein [Spirochaeta sp.]